jgi:uncharacterized Fe-S radical SAM superfamily protein PflX
MDGLVDIYMPGFKYSNAQAGLEVLSKVVDGR